MKTETAKKLVAEWIEEQRLPTLIRRDAPPVDMPHLADILAVVGPRRAGKTWYMYQLIEDLLQSGTCAKDDILFMDFEDYRLADFTAPDVETLLTAFNHVTGKSPSFLFFDEIQRLPNWSRVLRTLHNQRRFHIVVSGSNSELLSREVSTELRGRYRDVLILPFSFREMLRLRGVEYSERTFLTAGRGRILKAFDAYLEQGGFPEVLKREVPAERRQLLQNYYRTIFYRDILERHNVKAKYVLEAMMRYCLNVFADLFSISAFEKTLKQSSLPGSKRTISNYLHYLSEAFFLIVNEKFSFSPRKRLMNPKKVYLLDVGFSFLSTAFSENAGKVLENVVAIELFRRQEEVFYFKDRGECDFLIKQGQKLDAAIQVTWTLTDLNRERELNGLADAMSAHRLSSGLVLTYDQDEELTYKGHKVTVTPVWKWLLRKGD
ncbi:MAG: ATP-binding protein [Kiritimatiellia bacterium]